MFQAWDTKTSAFITAVASICTVLIALGAALIAVRQVREARRLREAQAQPFVVVDIEPGRVWANWLMLVIENIGTTLARDVHLTFDPPLTTTLQDSNVDGARFLRNGIAALPPGRRIESLLDLSHIRIEQNLPMRYAVKVKFSDFRGEEQTLNYEVDFSYLFDLEMAGEKTVHNVAESLDQIRREIERWRSSRGPGITVWTRDTERDIAEDQWQYALTGKHRSLARPGLREWAKLPGRSPFLRALAVTWRQRRDSDHQRP